MKPVETLLVLTKFFVLLHLTESTDSDFVTCGSVTKLINTDYGVRLYSQDVQYGSGSGQQSVTAINDVTESGAYWQISQGNGLKSCPRGSPIKCGQTIRLCHRNTKRNMHSHHFKSPLSQNYEVSAFGKECKGDDGDDWRVICHSAHWKRKEPIQLKHASTNGLLHVSGRTYSHPINGQYEVSASSSSEGSWWKTGEGLFIQSAETTQTGHDEL